MSIYCWGNTVHGELGLGGIEEEHILIPRKMSWKPDTSICHIACGKWHTLFLTVDGKVYSCGNNDNGQLGQLGELPTKRPQLIPELKNYKITKIACGAQHSVALSEWGQIFAWGENHCGQLGLSQLDDTIPTPKIIKLLIPKIIIQIACGNNHTLCLTSCGELYSWGSNAFGQLGVAPSNVKKQSNSPQLVTTIQGIPIAYIACGGNHSFIISKSGAVYGWGLNNKGQLGLSDEENRCYPTHLKTLRNLAVRYISCGEEFSTFLTNDGGVFTCGSGAYGQLGHGGKSNEVLPRMVCELMGSTITQIACGLRHTLALVPSRGRVYGFGLGCCGQLGSRVTNSVSVPQVVIGPWVSPSGSALIKSENKDNVSIKEIFSGGDQSLCITTDFESKIPSVDFRIYSSSTQILEITNDLAMQCAAVQKDILVDMDLITIVEHTFKSMACWNSSFLLDNSKHFCCSIKNNGVNFLDASTVFSYLRKIENESLKNIIFEKIYGDLMESLTTVPADFETLRIYLTLPLYHEFINSKKYEKLHTPFSNAVDRLTEIPKKIIRSWWTNAPCDWFENIVSNYKNVVIYIITIKMPPNSSNNPTKRCVTYNYHLLTALNLLGFLHYINHKLRKEKICYEIFNWPELMEYVDIQQDYVYWLFDKSPEQFNICNYPFLFDAATKTTILQTDQALQMHKAIQDSHNEALLSCFSNCTTSTQYVVLNVTRENIVQDTLREILNYKEIDLKKPLKIKFQDEEAEDAGGVRKEFFMLLLKDLLDPKYGMFKIYEESRALWFADVTFEGSDMYVLIGVICGLAIYNFTIINVPFPLALYKKLLEEPVDISDLRDLSTELANSMQSILDYEGDDFEEIFDLNFEISQDIFGEVTSVPLKPGGENIKVTSLNRKEFVDLYIDFIFNKSVDNQFKAFQAGFMKVCLGRVLQLFKPHELMAVVTGNEEYDWHAFEESCEYKNGYTSSDQTVRWFWEVLHELPEVEKKKFLLYLTGSDRIPVQGMKAVKINIQPTSDDKFLPVAHTCFNLLDLPRYKTKERLKYKLLQAIQQTQGFSIV
ncbi:probable E3 ubiquitin-protein ligase HERC4 isoform X2 [Teleopsis dalmanni]|uniref:probable E3 ubiquitin-protein ligase HERC4 isoform X2 n=1 Tax=Teleopsis dalmanni TaxID=139649 RepID=UPI0018CD2C66|nr:probable E3 ubiquitin-protein ligase HERC4 isoform X2 [Teleopsis dalmanni]XP_037939801.1 probable E3 ubiquitin-protein ligase HERC4 isoform X2 [Teleopsis dalmanni]